MTSDNEDKVVALLEKMAKAEAYKTGALLDLGDEAHKWAMLKATGSYVERGGIIHVSRHDQEHYLQMFLGNMQDAAMRLFTEDALHGAA